MVVQFATWPASVLCYRVWPDCVVSANGPLASSRRRRFSRCVKGDNDHGLTLPGNVTPVAQASQDSVAEPVIRTIQLSDLREALRLGWEDFKAVPSHAIILCVIYPVLGLVLARTVLGYSVLPLLFPLAAGFACSVRSRRSVSMN